MDREAERESGQTLKPGFGSGLFCERGSGPGCKLVIHPISKQKQQQQQQQQQQLHGSMTVNISVHVVLCESLSPVQRLWGLETTTPAVWGLSILVWI